MHINCLIDIQRHSASSHIVASTLNDGKGAIVVIPPRSDLTNDLVHGPREDVGGARDEKELFRIPDFVGEVVDGAVGDLRTEVVATAEMRGGGDMALIWPWYLESGVWIRPGDDGACGCALACRVGKDGSILASDVHGIEANVGGGGESVGEESRC